MRMKIFICRSISPFRKGGKVDLKEIKKQIPNHLPLSKRERTFRAFKEKGYYNSFSFDKIR
jgi:hypothetical protein